MLQIITYAGFALLTVMAGAVRTDADFRSVLQSVVAHQPELEKVLERFGYRETVLLEENGKLKKNEIYEVIMLRGRMVRKLISRDGKALQGSELAKENTRVEKQISNLESGRIPPLTNRRIDLKDLLRCSVFSDVREDTIDGRTVLKASFHPNPKVKPSNISERFVHNLDGVAVVDPVALQVARFEFTLRDAFKVAGGLFFAMKPGTRYEERSRWALGQIWLPESKEFQMAGKAMIGYKLAIRNRTSFSDYHRFDVEATSNQP